MNIYPSYQQRLNQAKELLQTADYLLVGGGAGLSDAAGLHYDGERFREHFAPFIAQYGFSDMYTAGSVSYTHLYGGYLYKSWLRIFCLMRILASLPPHR